MWRQCAWRPGDDGCSRRGSSTSRKKSKKLKTNKNSMSRAVCHLSETIDMRITDISAATRSVRRGG